MEINNYFSSKGLANSLVCEKMNLNINKAIHVGNSMNDYSVIKFMKLIVMHNSSKEIKQYANIVSNFTNRNSGLKKTLKKYLIL